MNHWLGRYVVKRLTWWVIITVAAAFLAFVGTARAYQTEHTFGPATLADTNNGDRNYGGTFTLGASAGGSHTVTVQVKGTTTGGVFYLGFDCTNTNGGVPMANAKTATTSFQTFTDTRTLSNGDTCEVYIPSDVQIDIQNGSVPYDNGLPDPTPTPTPTPEGTATPDPICDPYCIVRLSDEDQERLDALQASSSLSIEIIAAAFGIVVLLLSAATVSVGLRR